MIGEQIAAMLGMIFISYCVGGYIYVTEPKGAKRIIAYVALALFLVPVLATVWIKAVLG